MARAKEFPHSFEEALKAAARILSANHELVSRNLVDTEAEQIVLAAYRKASGIYLSRMQLHTRIRDRFPEKAGEEVLTMAALRAEGRLLQHVTGFQAFLENEYEVTPKVLIPRPETEVLVSLALERLRSSQPVLGLEVGLGSGAISIELMHSIPALTMMATELCPEALAIAQRNAERILGTGKHRLRILAASSTQVLEPFRGVTEKADFLVSNPPYLANRAEVEADVLEHEPGIALFAPEGDPLFFYRKIAEGAHDLLKPDGSVFLEVPHERAGDIAGLFQNNAWDARLFLDLNGHPRVLIAARA